MKAFKDGNTYILHDLLPDENGKEALQPVPNAPHFLRFEMGAGWLEPQLPGTWGEHWIVVVGEKEDNSYFGFEEHSGSLEEIGRLMISLKDRYFIRKIHIEDRLSPMLTDLRNPRKFDGLCGYANDGEGDTGMILYHHEATHWPDFRSRNTTASFIEVPELLRTLVGIGQCFDLWRGLADNGRFERGLSCHTIRWLQQQKPPFDELFRHPLLKALVWTLERMERTSPLNTVGRQPEPDYWYGNP